MEKISAVILAAGEGKRMNSKLPKVLHAICGRSLIDHVLSSVRPLSQEIIAVIGHGAEKVREALGDSVLFAVQEEQLGTGHAVLQAAPLFPQEGTVFVLCGDTPLLTAEIMGNLLEVHKDCGAAATVLTAHVPDAAGYGRMIRSSDGSLVKIVEDKDATAEERQINEINTGTYVFSAAALHETLQSLSSNNAQGEYYLTDCIELLIGKGLPVSSYSLEDYRLALGVNDRSQLSEAARLLRNRINLKHMEQGVTIIDTDATYVDVDVSIGRDTVLLPNTIILGDTVIGEDCQIGPCTELKNCEVGNGVSIRYSTADNSVLEDGTTVGPFANLRPETILRRGVKVGDFVEIKKSDVGPGSKVPHLSYVGDSQIGSGVNMGAGTIVVNYDGRNKHTTIIEEGAFIGCNSNLVAPLRVGKGAFVAAGSTVTKDVPAGALSLSRAPQVNKEKMAEKFIDAQQCRES